MSLTTCSITVAGTALDGAKDNKGNYYILVPQLEKALGWRNNQAREKVVSKSLKAFAGKDIRLGKKKDNRNNSRGYVGTINTREFMTLVGWEANNGNTKATALLIALATEAVERRIDSALQVETSEEEYERRTFEFFRELARKSFLPEFTSHLQEAEVSPNYGAEVNKLKQAAALPLKPIDNYTAKEIEGWSKAITRYDALRMEGYSHKRTLSRISSVTQARLG